MQAFKACSTPRERALPHRERQPLTDNCRVEPPSNPSYSPDLLPIDSEHGEE